MKLRVGAPFLFLLESRCHTVSSFSVHSSRYVSARHNFPPRGGHVDNNQPIHRHQVTNDLKLQATTSTEVSVDGCVDPSLKAEIENAAMNSMSITGPSLRRSKFGDIDYINTELLNGPNHKQHRVIFILGGPGAGKGTQSANIVGHYKCVHLSVGELLRQERKRKSPHSELIEECLVAGKIVPVEISLSLVRKAMDEVDSSELNEEEETNDQFGNRIFLVDGFPRNWANLEGWTSEMPDYAAVIGSLVYDCPIDVLEKRILSRAETSGRSDDNIESARKRFKTFQQETMPVVNALERVEKMQKAESEDGISMLRVEHISGDGSVEEVWDYTKSIMNSFVINDVLTANNALLRAVEDSNLDDYRSICSMNLSMPDIDQTSNTTSISDVEEVFNKYEVPLSLKGNGRIRNTIQNVSVDVQDGTKVVVSYDRIISSEKEATSNFRESRVWSHERKGWSCIHFFRKFPEEEKEQ